MELWVYEKGTHKPLGMVEGFFSLRMVRRYDEWGEITVRMPADEQSALLRPGAVVWPAGSPDAYVLDTVVIGLEEQEGGCAEVLEATGLSAAALLNRRVLSEKRLLTGRAGAVAAQLCGSVFSLAERQFAHFSIVMPAGLGAEIEYEMEPAKLGDALLALCRAEGLGLRSRFDPLKRAITVEMYAGADRSMGNSPQAVVFDPGYENITGPRYTDSTADMANAVYVIGEPPPKNSASDPDKPAPVRKVVEAGASGYDRFETFLKSAKGWTVNDGTETKKLTQAQYMKVLDDQGREKLAQSRRAVSLEGTPIIGNGPMELGTDYDLGDIVTGRVESWQVQSPLRLRELEEAYEDGLCTRHVMLGDPMPTINEKIKRL